MRHLYNQGELTASKIAIIIQRSVPTAEKKIERIRGNEYYSSTHGSSKNGSKENILFTRFEVKRKIFE